ncbi:MAG: 2Fe-2S iron-sulfur cluster binding domain-containing protein [Sulfuricurvum sp.]|jgi:ferredoxin|nr:2Fe-2S iron-sulfur cluster binding domain-containing protein [Sulfuricurvum sp.]MDP3021948.1 2Fe-2S iron-sulfur cluster binding domain-containing protein [Sulfuricurvum sp.]MDP3120320.1 2Fe-2S iron-sulfur cluster binding domain-containing protein [Sulfuricurvum sp.]MDP3300474.1 2Fe-2S iron-sulfur cluster binding domain-containing protein [Sulfuricurvum sp.]OYZ59818.1 MAG: ferredoxin [Sulfuricurvum sp. 24-42-5]
MTTRVEIINDFLAINVKPGKTIQDIVEASGSALPFGCRDGECGTCVVMIESGMEFMSPINDKEKAVLKTVAETSAKARLACQMKVVQPNGLVRIKY